MVCVRVNRKGVQALALFVSLPRRVRQQKHTSICNTRQLTRSDYTPSRSHCPRVFLSYSLSFSPLFSPRLHTQSRLHAVGQPAVRGTPFFLPLLAFPLYTYTLYSIFITGIPEVAFTTTTTGIPDSLPEREAQAQ